MLTAFIVISAFLLTLGVGGYVSDHLLKRSKRFNAFMDNLPMSWI